jgi:hypothetical protein
MKFDDEDIEQQMDDSTVIIFMAAWTSALLGVISLIFYWS